MLLMGALRVKQGENPLPAHSSDSMTAPISRWEQGRPGDEDRQGPLVLRESLDRRGTGMALEADQEVFHQHRRHLLKHHEGKFALVARGELVGVFETFDNAYVHGVARFGQSLFLVKQITRETVKRLKPRYAWLDSQIDRDS